ncbi:ribosome biogenesis GTPase YlqF [Geomicrobium sp. JCM 19039]|uniref:ribosome biogenesis GTPase YlqF n=1 Tax=Geomicrobium sp. JCM 19039 TaxID=1460636 RepID=UPI00045F3F2F|nr:ribosome biogenesis GTPase YlqF [Geomicrobium sp. JCM 19039]GAK10896.1 50S ribosomal subunit maturation GTPase RbgA [Geomicrobium sp. JCM 19039]
MTIQWFPGHMAKAIREMKENIKKVDVVIELLDARIPESSRNPVLEEVVTDQPRVLVLMKPDLADPERTKEWVAHYEQRGQAAVVVDAKKNTGIQTLIKEVLNQAEPKMDKLKQKGIRQRSVRAMIVGIPNVGKSTLINRLVGRNQATTGNKPGVTRKNEWLKVGKKMELLDTPGVLWPKFEDQTVGLRLAATGAIKDERLDFSDVALYLIRYLKEHYPNALTVRYNIKEAPSEDVAWFEEIGKRRGCLMSGGDIDFDQTSELILREFRSEKLGRITLERP